MVDRTVTTTGTGRVTEQPDLATARLTVRGSGDDPGSARERARGRAAEVRDALADTPVASEAVRTTGVRVRHRSDVFDGPETDADYLATEAVVVDYVPDGIAEAVVAATDAGARVDTVDVGLHESRREELSAAALRAATADARRRAETIAAAEGHSVGAVRDVSTQDPAGMESIVEEALDEPPEFDFQPDPVAVSAEVRATFDLADPGGD